MKVFQEPRDSRAPWWVGRQVFCSCEAGIELEQGDAVASWPRGESPVIGHYGIEVTCPRCNHPITWDFTNEMQSEQRIRDEIRTANTEAAASAATLQSMSVPGVVIGKAA